MAENSSHAILFSVEETKKGRRRNPTNPQHVKRNAFPRRSRNLENLHVIPTYDPQYHKRPGREETGSTSFVGKIPVGLKVPSKKAEYRRRYASAEKRTHRENRRRRRYRNQNEQNFFDPRYYWYSRSRDVAESAENLEEVSDVPLEEGDFEEVEAASSDAEKTAEIPVGFRKYHLRHLGYKPKGFFRPKLYNVCSQRTVVNCLNLQEDESVEVDVVSEAEYDMEQDREECEQPTLEETEDNEIEGEYDGEQDREECELITFEDTEDSGMEGDHANSCGNSEVQEVDCKSMTENTDTADRKSVKEKVDIHSSKEKIDSGNSKSSKGKIDAGNSKSAKEKIEVGNIKSAKEKIDIGNSKSAKDKIDVRNSKSSNEKVDIGKSKSAKEKIGSVSSKGAVGKVDAGSNKKAKEENGAVSCEDASLVSSEAEVPKRANRGSEGGSRTYNTSLPEKDSSRDLYQGASSVQSVLDSWNSHLIGLEYLLEIRSRRGEVERYHCLLCKQALPTRDGMHLISHIINTKHVMRYLDKHFPSCGFKAIENSVSEIMLQKCCEDIHHALGYSSISITNCDYFEKHKREIEATLEKMAHFDEKAFQIDARGLLPREEDPPCEAKEPASAKKGHQPEVVPPRKSEEQQVLHKKEEGVEGKQEKFVFAKPFRKTGCRSFLMLKCMEGSLLGKPTKSLKEQWRLDTVAPDKTDKSTKLDLHRAASEPAPVCADAKEDTASRVVLSSETKLGGTAKDEARQGEPEVPQSCITPTISEIVIAQKVESSAATPEPTTETEEAIVLEEESYLEIGEEKLRRDAIQKSAPKKKPKSHQKPTTHSKHCIKRLVKQTKPEEATPKKSRGGELPAGLSRRSSPGRSSGRVVRRRSANRSVRKRTRSPRKRRNSRSPSKLLPKTPGRRFSKSPVRRHSKSPGRRYSKSPGRRYSKSPGRRYSKSPGRRLSKSPGRRFSKSPVRRVYKSPVRRLSKSPIRRVYKSPIRRISNSPVRRISKSPTRYFTKSPIRRFSRSPFRRLSRSPTRRSSRSPLPRYSRSRSRTPRRRRSKSTSKSHSPQPKRRQHSFSRLRSRSPRRRRGRASPGWRGGSDLDSISDEDESLYFGAGEPSEWKHGESAHRASNPQAHMFLLQMMKQITGPVVDPNDPRVQRLAQFVEAHQSELGDLLGPAAGARPFLQQYLMSNAPVQSIPPQPPYPMHDTFARHPFQQSGHSPFPPTPVVHNAPFANPLSAYPHEAAASPMNPYPPPVPQKSKVPPEVAFKDLQATVSKLFGANKAPNEETKEKSPAGNYGTETVPVRWGPSPQNAPGFRPDAPLFLPPHPPPNAKVSFCGPSRPPPERSLFPVLGAGEGLVTERKISLAQRLASVLVKVGMTDVPAPLLQEMLMKIGAFSSCPPQDIQEDEIIAILKRLGYL